MDPVAYVAVALLSATVAGDRGDVTFERRYAVDPCDDRVLVFTTVGTNVSEIEHAFRLNCTDTLFVSRNEDPVPSWNGAKGVPSLSTEISFFRRQAEVIATAFRGFLERATRVELSYEFNAATGGYYCYFFLDEHLVSSCKSGMPYYHPALRRFEKYRHTVSRVRAYGRGVGLDLLKAEAATLGDKWRNFCEMLRALENNATDEYELRYDERIGGLVCSIRSATPWYRRIFFGRTSATEVRRDRDPKTGRYSTVGLKAHDPSIGVACTIVSPDGTIALQTFEPPQRTETPVSTVALSIISTLSTPSIEKGRTTTVGPSDPGDGTTSVSISLALIVVLVLSGIGLFVSRDRLEGWRSGFRRLPT